MKKTLSDYVEKLTAEIKMLKEKGILTHSVIIELDAEGRPVSAKISVG